LAGGQVYGPIAKEPELSEVVEASALAPTP